MCAEPLKTVGFVTFGCKLNHAETQIMREAFEARGFVCADSPHNADIVIVNTCTVTGATDHQCRQALRHALRRKERDPSARIIATGCYAQTNPEGLLKMVPGLDLVAGNREKEMLADLALELRESHGREPVVRVGGIQKARSLDPPRVARFSGMTRAYLRVQDGCDNRCAYCIIPQARGPSRSLRPESALEQARAFANAGHLEVVITGIHAGRYGRDLKPATSLAALLADLHTVPGIERIRISSLEPGEFTPELLDALRTLPRICPHFHISLQSGDAGVLSAMRRRYSPQNFSDAVRAIRSIMPDAAIGADVITGFPGESDEAHENTCRFLEETAPAYLHVFRYSPRPGTPAADMADQVPETVKKQRSAGLHAIRSRFSLEFRKQFEGRTMAVLFEHRRAQGLLTGLTGNYLRVAAQGPDSLMGCITPVKITRIAGAGLHGEIANRNNP